MADEEEKTRVTSQAELETLRGDQPQGAPRLVVLQGKDLAAQYPLETPELHLGRIRDVDITLEGEGVSRDHARILQEGTTFVVEDLNSTNGTFVNDTRVDRHVLKEGDHLKIGPNILKFVVSASETNFHEEVYRLTTRDGLTEAYNKRHFMEHLDRECERYNRYGGNVALIIFDIDHFKTVNDTYGHLAGDAVLRELSSVARECIRRNDFFARYGGEEFALILPECSEENAAKVCEKLRAAIEDHSFQFEDQSIPVTVSLGVAFLNETSQHKDSGAFIAAADAKLYEAKRGGRNRVCV
jgi:diguanylate cyclase (GGDEF)-like protein